MIDFIILFSKGKKKRNIDFDEKVMIVYFPIFKIDVTLCLIG